MTNPERLLVLKERYLILTDFDVIKASILAKLDYKSGRGRIWVTLTYDELVEELLIPTSRNAVIRRVKALEKHEWLEVERNGNRVRYRVNASKLAKAESELEVTLFHGYVIDPQEWDAKEYGGDKVMVKPTELGATVEVVIGQDGRIPGEQTGKDFLPTLGTRQNFPTHSGYEEGESGNNFLPMAGSKVPTAGRKLPTAGSKSDSEISNGPHINNTSYILENNTSDIQENNTSATQENSSPDVQEELQSKSTARLTKNAKSKTRGQKFYTWEHYAKISEFEWKQARDEGIFPKNETANTLVLGAYLLAMKHKHGRTEGLIAKDFGGKYGKNAKEMLQFFTAKNNGDELAGFREALDWIREFARAGAASYIGKAGWPIQLCFTRDMYRQKGQVVKKSGKARNNTGVIVMDESQREERTKEFRRIRQDD